MLPVDVGGEQGPQDHLRLGQVVPACSEEPSRDRRSREGMVVVAQEGVGPVAEDFQLIT